MTYSRSVCEQYFDNHGFLTPKGRKAFGIPTSKVCDVQVRSGSIESVINALNVLKTNAAKSEERRPIIVEDEVGPSILHDGWQYINW